MWRTAGFSASQPGVLFHFVLQLCASVFTSFAVKRENGPLYSLQTTQIEAASLFVRDKKTLTFVVSDFRL